VTRTIDPQRQPLLGLRVVEFCTIAAGPFCAMQLGDLGAEVIKIEPPGGDPMRAWPPLTESPDGSRYSENFASLNRGKRSLVLDLKEQGQQRLARRLCLSADVVLENNRPGVMERLGLGPAGLLAEKPSLVYASISAFGQEGPRAQQGGFDVVLQAFSGIMSVTGSAGGEPVKCGVPLSDMATGLYAAFAIVAKLLAVRAGGPGGHIDASMLGASLGIAALQTSEYFGSGRDPLPLGSAHPRNAPYQAFRAADDWLVLAAGNDRLWQAVTGVIDRPDLLADPRFASIGERAANQAALKIEMERALAAAPAATWIERFNAVGVPCAPINSYSAVLADPQVAARNWVLPMTLPNGADIRTVGPTLGLDGAPPPLSGPPPALDGDREAVAALLDREEAEPVP